MNASVWNCIRLYYWAARKRVRDVYIRHYSLLAPRVGLKSDFSKYDTYIKLLCIVPMKAKISLIKMTYKHIVYIDVVSIFSTVTSTVVKQPDYYDVGDQSQVLCSPPGTSTMKWG